jgi:amino-acid N-acetyltransferase
MLLREQVVVRRRLQAAARGEVRPPEEGCLIVRTDSAGVISRRPSLVVVRAMLASANLPTSDLTEEHCEHFFFAGNAASPTGVVGIEAFGAVGLLRSLAVIPSARGNGAGTALVNHAEEYARARGIRSLYLLTTTAEPFFSARGYSNTARDQAPEAIRSTAEFADICPASSAFMSKRV